MVVDAIRKAQTTGLFDIVAVTSDDVEILELAVASGALPVYRSAWTSGDVATDTDVAIETLRPLGVADRICKLYPCVPLLDNADIVVAYFKMVNDRLPGIYSVDGAGNDAGAFYWFTRAAFDRYGTVALDRFPWSKHVLQVCQDINTPEDLEAAKRKAGLV